MAEVVGFVSAGVGITAFALKITGSINALREASKFSESKAVSDLSCLSSRLEALRRALLDVKAFGGHRIVDLTIRNCSETYYWY